MPQIGSIRLGAPGFLGLGLFAITLYAAFAEGAIRAPQEPRVQVAVAVLAALAAIAWLWFSALTLRLPRLALLALGLLLAFCAWSALTLAWSAAPSDTWTEVNRLFTYSLVLALGLALGASARGAVESTVKGLLVLTMSVSLYGLAQKVIPGLHIDGVVDLNQTGQFARLQAPLDYWNAMALFVTLGAPAGLTLALQAGASLRSRLLGLSAVELIVVTIGFTESRGGFIALAVALAATVLLSPDRLATLLWAAVAVGAGVLDLAVGLLAHPLTGNGVALSSRELAGVYLLVVLVAVATLSALAIRPLDALPALLTRPRRRGAGRILGYGAVGLIVIALIGASLSHRGLGGQISHIWNNFNNADSIPDSSASRLLSGSSANRVDWWGQALRAFATRPLGGYGSGSFPVINLLFRHDTVSAQDAHSVPLQWLAETGVVGFVLAAGAWVTLLGAGVRAVRRAGAQRIDPTRLDSAPARRRLAAAALLAAAMAYSVHALYDWDWDIPGVTLPVLIILGVLAGSLAPGIAETERPASGVVVPQELVVMPQFTAAARLGALGALIAVMCLFGISAVLPEIAADKASAAVTDAGRGTAAGYAQARHEASFASSLNPLSDAGPLASASVAVAEGELGLARDYLIEAVRRQPTDEQAWDDLVNVDLGLHRDPEALTAAQRALQVDPELGQVAYLSLAEEAISANLDGAPPRDSATAVPTPGT